MTAARRRPGRIARRLLGALAGLALAAAAPPGRTGEDLAPSGLEGAQALAPFFAALDEMKAGRRAGPVHVIQIGDSHSAADYIASGVRVRLQAVFGEAGRGVLPPGRPFGSYSPRQVEVAQSDGWRLEPSFPVTAGAFGVAGWRLTSTRPGASVTMTADPEARFDRAVVCAAAGPGAGVISVAGDHDDDAAACWTSPPPRRAPCARPSTSPRPRAG